MGHELDKKLSRCDHGVIGFLRVSCPTGTTVAWTALHYCMTHTMELFFSVPWTQPRGRGHTCRRDERTSALQLPLFCTALNLTGHQNTLNVLPNPLSPNHTGSCHQTSCQQITLSRHQAAPRRPFLLSSRLRPAVSMLCSLICWGAPPSQQWIAGRMGLCHLEVGDHWHCPMKSNLCDCG